MKHKIHTTSEFENLKNILKSKTLRLKFSDEEFFLLDKKISSAAHPMICFSEYNLETIDKETITYGKFAIAFKDEWVKKNRIHRVLYVSKDSLVAKSLAVLLKARRLSSNSKLPSTVRLSIIEIKCFTKNETGYNSHFKVDNYDFSSENEWRYVPAKAEIDGGLISESSSRYKKKKELYNRGLERYSLKFEAKDIECIFVESKAHISELLEIILIGKEKVKISNWSTKLEDKLISK